MKPIDKAKEMYAAIGKDFNTVLLEFANKHYVHITPDALIFAECRENYWFIEVAVGKGALAYFLSLMPVYRPFVAFARGLRGGELKYYSTEKMKRCI